MHESVGNKLFTYIYLNILMFIVIVCNSRPFAPNKAGLKPYILLCTNDFGAADLMIQ